MDQRKFYRTCLLAVRVNVAILVSINMEEVEACTRLCPTTQFHVLARRHGIYVVLDVHQDAVGTATCGEGVPQWFSAMATPGQIGKPLIPLPGTKDQPFPWVPKTGWDGKCFTNDTASWSLYAGAVDYNTKNPCCLRYNQGGSAWGRLEATWQAQETVAHLFNTASGRHYYSTYGLLTFYIAPPFFSEWRKIWI